MYKYEAIGESNDMLEFDVVVDVTQYSALVDIDDDFLCTRPDGEGMLFFVTWNRILLQSNSASNHDEDPIQQQNSASSHDEETKSLRGPTIKSKASKGKTLITYDKRGVPIGEETKSLATFEGMTARTVVPITYDCWLDVPKQRKEECWQYVSMQQTGKIEEEIDRATLWKKARELKTGGFDPEVQVIADKILDICESIREALGTQEQRGHVRGMGKFVKPQQYFFEPKTVKQYSDIEKMVDERFNKLEEELQTLKRGMINVSEGASCQMGGYEEDFEDEPLEEILVSLGYKCENIEVMMELSVQGEALLPIPLEDEFTTKVKDAVGHILSWPRHLVIRCSDLDGKENAKKDEERLEEKDAKKTRNEKENEKVMMQRRMTRTQRKTMIRIEQSASLKMIAVMVDEHVSKVDSIKVQCEDDLFGYESFTYLNWDDFEAVFTLQELTGAVITSYMM
ncbi:hypothetical protein L1987_84425 [Smallanthus sonchifolius]|uniref:Uncharacterized protein n=1 Tax=Smallanthus sonchifolius TaxID=185202 RepID=A0ACB8YEN5_9ASTR|nr:hypothetical protein L1987_84425 [Smallanthus sonchifolius]